MKSRIVLLVLLSLSITLPVAAGSLDGRTTPDTVHLPLIAVQAPESHPRLSFAYGPYRPGQAPGEARPSAAEIAQDMNIVGQDASLIRTYGSCDEWTDVTYLAGQHEIGVYQGVALSNSSALNERELQCYSNLLPDNRHVERGIVGNEVLLKGDLSEVQLVQYVTRAKQDGDVPVSTAETWDTWCALQADKPRCPGLSLLSEEVDFVTANVHPYWEDVPVEHAAAHVVAVYIFLRAAFAEKEIVIGETGWPTCGQPLDGAVPGVANQRLFAEELLTRAQQYGIPVFYFEAFDEEWKSGIEGEVGGCWGLYNADRTPKHESLTWDVPTPEPTPSTPAVRIDHPQGSTTTEAKSNCGVPLFGRVHNAQPGWQVEVEVLTDRWYIQDQWYENGRAPIIDGLWSMPDVALAGQGPFNDHTIRATLVDASGRPIGSAPIRAEVAGIVRSNDCVP